MATAFSQVFPIEQMPRSYPPLPTDRREFADLGALQVAIGHLHLRRCQRLQGQLDAVAARMQESRPSIAPHREQLDDTVDWFARAWAGHRDYRAAFEARGAIVRHVGVSLEHLRQERVQHQSIEGSLASLRLALDYTRLAKARRKPADFLGESDPLAAWAHTVPSPAVLEAMIVRCEQRLAKDTWAAALQIAAT